VPAGLVHHHNGMFALCHFGRNPRQKQVHGGGVALGKDQPGGLAILRADRPKYVG
jgi:hypothetical protein